MELEGRVAMVTGGGRGIGQAISIALAEAGAAVAINYRKDEESARQTMDTILAGGGKAKLYQASVDTFDECKAMVEQVIGDFGYIDILINNAGISSRGNSVHDTDPAEMERVVRTHSFGPFYMSKLVLDSMRARPRGDIVMISSAATTNWGANGSPYNMGKAAMEGLARTLAKEEVKHGIHVNIVCPGITETRMGINLAYATRGAKSKENLRDLDEQFPFGHVPQPSEVAAVVKFLVSDASRTMTGQRIETDGGGLGPVAR